MPTFKDNHGREWRVELDAPLMGEVRTATGVDLGDLNGGGYLKIESDVIVLVAVAKILCRDEIKINGLTPEQFGKALRKDALPQAAAAIVAAAADFFPTSSWSAIQSSLLNARKFRAQLAGIAPVSVLVEDPSVPDQVKGIFLELMALKMREEMENSTSALSTAAPSAGGPAVIPSNAPTVEPAKSE